MTRALSAVEVLRLRTRAQGLAERPALTVDDAVRRAGGVQAQATAPARLAVRPRSTGLDARAVTRACNDERSVVRTWTVRGTLHMVPAEDVGWLVGLLGPVFAAAGRRRRLQLGLDEDACDRGLRALRAVLADSGPLVRGDLVRELAARGVALDPRSQAPAHLLAYAAMRGLVCRGPDAPGDEPTYVLLADWVGARPAVEPDDALAELARRHLRAFGPAGPEDFATWSGLPRAQARRGFELVGAELAEVEAAGERAWLLAAADPLADLDAADARGPCVRLLPHFDTSLLGHRSRHLALAPAFARRINRGGGWIHPTLAVDGRVLGTWRRDGPTITVDPFAPLDPALLPGLEAEAADIGRFLAVETSLEVMPA